MGDFPAFMKHPANRIASESQYTDSIEGYGFDGADGSQVAFWTSRENRVSKEHAHDFDEYLLIIEGRGAIVVDGRRTELTAGEEFVVPKGTVHSMEAVAGTRTMHGFGGPRAQREADAHPPIR